MRHIMVLNAKGGCGKSTLATNIASYFANEGATVALADYDPQRSSLDWLERRPDNRPAIAGVAAFEDGLRHVPRGADIVVSDAPARSHGSELTDLVKHAETIVVPVLASTIDMQATTAFLKELKEVGKVRRREDGKILKPEGWVNPGPLLEAEIIRQYEEGAFTELPTG